MLPQIPSESSYATWLMACTKKFFELLGFEFYSEIQSQVLEENHPFDIYVQIKKGNKVKQFGFQVKRSYISSKGELFWRLDETQHENMKKFSWMIYSFPDFIDRKYFEVACFYFIFKMPYFSYVSNYYKKNLYYYERFGSIARKIIDCPFGNLITSEAWINPQVLMKEFEFINQFQVYLDFTEMKGQIFSNII